jgi:uncharacterized protein YpmB
MEIIKKALFAIILLFVVVVAWVAFYVYFESSKITVDPNAETYKTQIEETFDLEELDMVYERTQETLPVTPDVFLSLIEGN